MGQRFRERNRFKDSFRKISKTRDEYGIDIRMYVYSGKGMCKRVCWGLGKEEAGCFRLHYANVSKY